MTTTTTPEELIRFAADAAAVRDTDIRTDTSCPSWCDIDHDGGEDDWGIETATGKPVRTHVGPSFGPIEVGSEQDFDGLRTPNAVMDDLSRGGLDAAALRELAANATAAAQWFEEFRAGTSCP